MFHELIYWLCSRYNLFSPSGMCTSWNGKNETAAARDFGVFARGVGSSGWRYRFFWMPGGCWVVLLVVVANQKPAATTSYGLWIPGILTFPCVGTTYYFDFFTFASPGTCYSIQFWLRPARLSEAKLTVRTATPPTSKTKGNFMENAKTVQPGALPCGKQQIPQGNRVGVC